MNVPTLTIQLGYNHYVAKKNTEGIDHEQSLVQPQPAGNNMNWILGHVVATRNHFLKIVGLDPIWSDEQMALYDRASKPMTDADAARPFEDLVSDFDRTQEMLMPALAKVTSEQMAEPAPFSPANREDETVGSLMAGLVFHESYHLGQTGIVRRLVGSDGALT